MADKKSKTPTDQELLDGAEAVIRPPAKSEKGFFRRELEMAAAIASGNHNRILELILEFCEITPPDGLTERDVVLDLSHDEFFAIIRAIRGLAVTVNPPSDA